MNKFTILIADDDLDDQELMKRGLNNCKVTLDLVQVHDGVQVMDYLYRRHHFKGVTEYPDVILMDLNMPLMDGFETIAQIKKSPALLSIPIYVVTTSREVEHLHRALDLGAVGVYSKGASSADIFNIMREVCTECFEPASKDLLD